MKPERRLRALRSQLITAITKKYPYRDISTIVTNIKYTKQQIGDKRIRAIIDAIEQRKRKLNIKD